MASDRWLKTILIVRKETHCRHIGYSFRLTPRVLLYAPSHRQDSTYHGLCYTSRGELGGTRNNSMGLTFTQFSSCHITQNGRLLCCQTLPGYLYIMYYKSKLDVLLRKIGLLLPTDVTEITEATRSTRLSVCVMDGIGWSTHPHGQLFRGEMTHSTHFIYGYLASNIWLRTILIVRKETSCRHIGYSFRLTARVLLYAPSHRQDNTYHGLCYTSRGALAGTRNNHGLCYTSRGALAGTRNSWGGGAHRHVIYVPSVPI